jgi:predicted DNA-binding WGR domain protein
LSFDLLVFDPQAAPRSRKDFMAWYSKQTEWTEAHGYSDPRVCTPALRSWFFEMSRQFPPMSGPVADDIDDSLLTDYSIGRSLIYAAFAWSQADKARKQAFQLAKRHRVGFFEVSARKGRIWTPVQRGKEGNDRGRREFHYQDAKSNKFWAITLKGSRHEIHFGRLGTQGQMREKRFATAAKAQAAYESVIASKLAKGYVEVPAPAAKKGKAPKKKPGAESKSGGKKTGRRKTASR